VRWYMEGEISTCKASVVYALRKMEAKAWCWVGPTSAGTPRERGSQAERVDTMAVG
jgi:hypothetical protein